ncbi:MAG: CARDB domain-containing protein, partial [Candidatus Omnitrophota bacterium]
PSITFEVRNSGDIDALVGCPLKIEFDHPDFGTPWWIALTGSVAGDINVDEPRLVTFENINIDDHSSRLKVTVDQENIITEEDESNNSAEGLIPEIRAITPEVTTMH